MLERKWAVIYSKAQKKSLVTMKHKLVMAFDATNYSQKPVKLDRYLSETNVLYLIDD